MQRTDQQLLAQYAASSGAQDVFGILIARYQRQIRTTLFRLTRGDRALVDDLAQETFVKAYENLEKFKGESSFYTWLYRVVMNLCLDHKRRDRSPQNVEWEETVASSVDPGSADASNTLVRDRESPEGSLARAQLREVVAQAIEQLPEDARQTLVLREIEGLSYAEIATCLDVPKGTVMSRLHHARRRVREILIASGAVGADGDLSGLAKGEA